METDSTEELQDTVLHLQGQYLVLPISPNCNTTAFQIGPNNRWSLVRTAELKKN